jgi:ABC-type nickel/cobalt efflux system permease component RcnA
VSTRFLGWAAAVLATAITVALVVVELTNAGQRRWWSAHPLTTDTVAGLLVLLITVLVVNQLLNRRQARQRGHAVASQAAIMAAQAARSAQAVSALLDGSGDRDAASDGFRTYMMMLLTGAPVLISDPIARHFLEQAQSVGGQMARILAAIDKSPKGATVSGDGLAASVRQLQSAAAPLLQLLTPAVRDSIGGIGQTAEE